MLHGPNVDSITLCRKHAVYCCAYAMNLVSDCVIEENVPWCFIICVVMSKSQLCTVEPWFTDISLVWSPH